MIETGEDYEQFCADELKKYGFKNIRLTKSSGDYGVDIVCEKRGEKWAVQCKYYSSHVGLGAVQQAAAGKAMYECDRAMVITNSVFTSQAKELAMQNGVDLWEELEPKKSALKILAAVLILTYIVSAIAIILSVSFSGGSALKTAAWLSSPAIAAVIIFLAVKKIRKP